MHQRHVPTAPLDKQAGWTFRFDFRVRLTDTRCIHRHDDVFNSASPVNSVDMQFCRHFSLRTVRNSSAQNSSQQRIRNAPLQWSHICTSQSLHSCWWGLGPLQHQRLPAATRYSVLASKYELSSKQHSQASKNYQQELSSTNSQHELSSKTSQEQGQNREQFHHEDDKHFIILQHVTFYNV